VSGALHAGTISADYFDITAGDIGLSTTGDISCGNIDASYYGDATAAEVGWLSGTTSGIQSQLNALTTRVGTTATVGHGIIGLTDSIQSQISSLETSLAAKAPIANASFTGNTTAAAIAVSGAVTAASFGAATSTEIGYLSGVTSAVQTQLAALATSVAARAPLASPALTGNATAGNLAATGNLTAAKFGSATLAEVNYLSGVTSAIQPQFTALTTAIASAVLGNVSPINIAASGTVSAPTLSASGNLYVGTAGDYMQSVATSALKNTLRIVAGAPSLNVQGSGVIIKNNCFTAGTTNWTTTGGSVSVITNLSTAIYTLAVASPTGITTGIALRTGPAYAGSDSSLSQTVVLPAAGTYTLSYYYLVQTSSYAAFAGGDSYWQLWYNGAMISSKQPATIAAWAVETDTITVADYTSGQLEFRMIAGNTTDRPGIAVTGITLTASAAVLSAYNGYISLVGNTSCTAGLAVTGNISAAALTTAGNVYVGTGDVAATAVVAAAAEPLLASGCALWFDAADPLNTGTAPANGATLSTWYDKSGAARNAVANTPVTYSTAGLNGRPALTFTKAEYLTGSLSLTNPTLTVFAVCSMDADAGIYARVASFGILGTSDSDSPAYAAFMRYNTGTGIQGFRNQTIAANNVTTIATPYLFETWFDGTNNYNIAHIGDTTTATSVATSATNFAISDFRLGAQMTVVSTNPLFKGVYSEIIVYGTVLTTAQRQSVEGYMSWKWGLQANLSSTHPYSATNATLGAPTSLAATAGASQVSIAFTAGAKAGVLTIVNYQYSTDGGATYTAFAPAQTASPLVISGLTNGTEYTVKLKAVALSGYIVSAESAGVSAAAGSRVGINTVAPLYNLDVNGTMRVVGTTICADVTATGNLAAAMFGAATSAEVGWLSGVTSAIQSQFDTLTSAVALNAPLSAPAFTGTATCANLTATGNLVAAKFGAATSAEVGWLSGVTSAIQTQLTAKAPLASPSFTGTPAFVNATFSGTLLNGTTLSINCLKVTTGVNGGVNGQFNGAYLINASIAVATNYSVPYPTPTTVIVNWTGAGSCKVFLPNTVDAGAPAVVAGTLITIYVLNTATIYGATRNITTAPATIYLKTTAGVDAAASGVTFTSVTQCKFMFYNGAWWQYT
jgi:hypothetical protein